MEASALAVTVKLKHGASLSMDCQYGPFSRSD
jgi:hypothetical protein